MGTVSEKVPWQVKDVPLSWLAHQEISWTSCRLTSYCKSLFPKGRKTVDKISDPLTVVSQFVACIQLTTLAHSEHTNVCACNCKDRVYGMCTVITQVEHNIVVWENSWVTRHTVNILLSSRSHFCQTFSFACVGVFTCTCVSPNSPASSYLKVLTRTNCALIFCWCRWHNVLNCFRHLPTCTCTLQ